MAQKRMFNKLVVNSDEFLEMPDSSQNLYFHLSMQADDDGFVDNWKSIMRMTGKKEDDMKILISKSFIIPFDTGVIVIRHWRLNNYIQKDRYKETIHIAEKQLLTEDTNNVYNLYTECIQNGYSDKNSIDKNRLVENSIEVVEEKEEEQLQQLFIRCTGSTNLNAIDECLSYLEDFPYEVIEIALKKTSEKNGRLEIR